MTATVSTVAPADVIQAAKGSAKNTAADSQKNFQMFFSKVNVGLSTCVFLGSMLM